MGTAVKGLLKGLRYISEIFEADNEKEQEIQIGMPTDVKHIAHIGCDGPSTNAPSWMNDFQGSEGSSDVGGSKDSFVTCTDSMSSQTRRGKSKQPKKQGAGSSVGSSPDIEPKARRSKNSAGDSPMNETSRPRRSKNSGAGAESPSQDPGAKKTRKKKVASSDGNTRPSRTKNRDPSPTDNAD